MSFIAELKQRKVFRVAAAHLVATWVAVQAASIALPAFEAPDWTLRVVILLFALGFTAALMLARALEPTPQGLHLYARTVGNTSMAPILALHAAWPAQRRVGSWCGSTCKILGVR